MNTRTIFVRGTRRAKAALAFAALWLPSLAFAHAADDSAGFMAGLMHPVFGFDHLLAMVSVGILSAQLGGANIWRVPVAFVSAMVVGGLIGIAGLPLPLTEIGIALSVIVLGLAITVAKRETPPTLPFVFVLFFGICHGYAHGLEMPASASPAFYTFGFLISTSALHIAGVVIGELTTRRAPLYRVLRYGGAVMSGIGVTFLLGHVGVGLA